MGKIEGNQVLTVGLHPAFPSSVRSSPSSISSSLSSSVSSCMMDSHCVEYFAFAESVPDARIPRRAVMEVGSVKLSDIQG